MTTWSMGQQPAAHRLMDGSPSLTGEDRTLAQRTVVSFEDDAMNTQWTRHDGAQLLQDIATTMLPTGTSPPATAGQWGQTTTAAGVATSLTAVEDVLDSAATATRSGTATVG